MHMTLLRQLYQLLNADNAKQHGNGHAVEQQMKALASLIRLTSKKAREHTLIQKKDYQ